MQMEVRVLSNNLSLNKHIKHQSVTFARLAQLVERVPFKHVVVGSIPTVGKSDVAQRLACLAHNQKVGGSIPLVANYGSSQQFLIMHYKPEVDGSKPSSH